MSRKRFEDIMVEVSAWLFVGALIAFIVMFFASCATEKIVTVEKIRIDTTTVTKWQRDSVWLHDSVYVKEKGDSVLVEKWHTKYIEKVSHDTLYQATHDTIPQPYPVEKEVPAKLSWWQSLRLWLGNIFLMALASCLCYLGWRMYRVYKYF